MTLLLLLLAALPQDDNAALKTRIKELVSRLDSENAEERQKAEDGLLDLPARASPFLVELDSTKFSAAKREFLERLIVPDPWAGFLRGSIKEARQSIDAIRKHPNPNRWKALKSALVDLSGLPEAEIRKSIDHLLSNEEAGFRDFGLQACVCWPPKDLQPVRGMLKIPELAMSAAHALVAAGDTAAVPEAVELYVKQRESSYTYMNQLLCIVGVEDRDIDRVIASWKNGHEPAGWDFAIVAARMSPKAIEALSAYVESNKRNAWAVDILLAWLSGDSALPVIRAGRAKRTAEEGKLHILDPFVWDPEVAIRWLDGLGADPILGSQMLGRFQGWIAGTLLRDKVLARIKDPATKASLKGELIRLLGTAGLPEDAPLLVEYLDDPRFTEDAAEALSKVGGPAHAKAMLKAFMKAKYGGNFGRTLLAFESDDLEGTLIEIMSDPKAYMMQATFAVGLAGRRLTPKLRDFVIENFPKWQGYQAVAGEKMLLDSRRLKDKVLVKKLLASDDPILQGIGEHLAFRNGSNSGERAVTAAHDAFSRQPEGERLFWLEMGLDAGLPWTDAVAKYWKDHPTWGAATNWLARQGRREAQAALDKAAKSNPAEIDQLVSKAWEGRTNSHEEAKLIGTVRAGNEKVKRDLLAMARHEVMYSHGPGTRMSAQLALPEGLKLYRLAVSRCDFRTRGNTGQDGLIACIQALVRLKDSESLSYLRRQVRSEDPSVRAAAMDALAAFRDKDGAPWIVRFLDDDTLVPVGERRTEMWTLDWTPPDRVWNHTMAALEATTGEKPPPGTDFERRDFWRRWAAKADK